MVNSCLCFLFLFKIIIKTKTPIYRFLNKWTFPVWVTEQHFNTVTGTVTGTFLPFWIWKNEISDFYAFVFCSLYFLVIIKMTDSKDWKEKTAARPVGVSAMLIISFYRLRFRFKVRFQPNLVILGTQRKYAIATCGKTHVNPSVPDSPNWRILTFEKRLRDTERS